VIGARATNSATIRASKIIVPASADSRTHTHLLRIETDAGKKLADFQWRRTGPAFWIYTREAGLAASMGASAQNTGFLVLHRPRQRADGRVDSTGGVVIGDSQVCIMGEPDAQGSAASTASMSIRQGNRMLKLCYGKAEVRLVAKNDQASMAIYDSDGTSVWKVP